MAEARTSIIVALIGTVGVITAAYIAHMPADPVPTRPVHSDAASTEAPEGRKGETVAAAPAARGRIDPRVLGATEWIDQDGREVEVRVYPGRVLISWQGAPNLVFHGSATKEYTYSGDLNDPEHPNCLAGFKADATLRMNCPGLRGTLTLVLRTASS